MSAREDTEDRALAYVAGELSDDARRAFEEELARDPVLRADVDGLIALQSILDEDVRAGALSGEDDPPPHLMDAILRAEALARPPELRAAMADHHLARTARDDGTRDGGGGLVSRLATWIFGGGAAVLVAGAFVFLVMAKGDAPAPGALFESEASKTAAPAAPAATADEMQSDGAAFPVEDPATAASPAGGDVRQQVPAEEPTKRARASKSESESRSLSTSGEGGEALGGGGLGAKARRGAGRFDDDAREEQKPMEAFSGAKLDAAREKNALADEEERDDAQGYVVDAPGSIVGSVAATRKPLGEAPASAAAPAAAESKRAWDAPADKASSEPDALPVAKAEALADEGFADARGGALDDDTMKAKPKASASKDAVPPPAPAKKPSTLGSLPSSSSGPPALSAEEGAVLRSLRGAELEKAKKAKENKKGAIAIDEAAEARRRLEIETTFATANSEFARGQYESALDTYASAAALDVKGQVLGVLPHVGRMRTLNRLSRFSETLALVKKLSLPSARKEDVAEGYLQAGDAAYALSRLAEAESFYKKARAVAVTRVRAETGLAAVAEKRRAPKAEPASAAEAP